MFCRLLQLLDDDLRGTEGPSSETEGPLDKMDLLLSQ